MGWSFPSIDLSGPWDDESTPVHDKLVADLASRAAWRRSLRAAGVAALLMVLCVLFAAVLV